VETLAFLMRHITMRFLAQVQPGFARPSSPLWMICAITVLLLGQQSAAADKSAADYFIKYLPGQPEGPLLKMHAG
jgi:hypothetical protein